ncbi:MULTISPECIES: hypothetical protein [Polaribacter]|uniref:Uncharacterized protein n=1 Tax=Polaribacter sejongensis TaxID=985043 RepID=A0ABM6PVA0_9FLAO|nr:MULTISPECIES: hypothetical protein [Polaribacter]AUC20617.1 hypothetical protein BTO15_00135 [Polaribacter sejongensis]
MKGNGLFDLGFMYIKFKDTLNTFSNSIIYPKNIKNLKRFQLKTDYGEKQDYNVEILLGNKKNKQIFIVDGNNNKDLTDDLVRECEKIIWNSPPKAVKCEYLISNGKQIIKDSSWLCIANNKGKILLGKREHLIGKFTIDNENFEIGVADQDNRNPKEFTYDIFSKITVLSNLGVKKEKLVKSHLMSIGELINLNNKYYRFESISNNGDLITLIKDENFKTKIGTQKGIIAPTFEVVTISGDTIRSSNLKNKITVIANSCGCGGDKKSTEAFYEMEKSLGKLINILHVDSNLKKSDIGIHIDSEEEFNKSFYNNYRKQYCSKTCYVIGMDNRIIDKFNINEWKTKITKIIKEKN